MEFLQEELDEILNIFSQEGAEILQSMDKNLLLLEKKPNNPDIAMHLFRDAHSLKGSARMLGFEGIQNIAHKIEDVLGLIREGKLAAEPNVTDAISDALACIESLIKKTVEQKSEYISEESNYHIKKLEAICAGEPFEEEKGESGEEESEEEEPKKEEPEKEEPKETEADDTKETEDEEEKIEEETVESLKTDLDTFENLVVSMVSVYTRAMKEGKFERFSDILAITNQLSFLCKKINSKELLNACRAIQELVSKSIEHENKDRETLLEINLKINDFVKKLSNLAKNEGLETKKYYDNKEMPHIGGGHIENLENNSDSGELKNVELLELITKAKETIVDINKNRHSLAEVKSLLNEIVSRLITDDFKKIYQTILNVILNFEKSGVKLEVDSIDALKEIFQATAGVIEARSSKNVYNDFAEEIDLIGQKAAIIAQMIKYELQNPNQYSRQQKSVKPMDWAQSFDSSSISIKTLRVNSDKLDKLVNQIGNLIVARIKSHENVGLVKTIQDELVELQKHYHKIGYYMKFYEKKYIQDSINRKAQDSETDQKKDSFLGYNKQLISFHNSNAERMNLILSNLSLLMKELQENNIKLNAATSEIENMVKSMRILPLSTVFNLFPRMVHNIAKDKGKEIELTIEGQEVSADKKIIEDIKIPIMHIIRNSLDHGVETPRERERLGKPRLGNIVIKASQKESKIVISIKDDGRGINIEKIKQKAVEKGFTTQEAADMMSKEQLANFIFYPGFSTGDTVTELSGRGLGLDIVHSKISQLNGRIDVYSEENKGTVVTMELPTTMATMKTFIIMENNQLFAVPTGSIQTVLRIALNDVIVRDGRYYFIYENQAIPLCSLSSILNLKTDEEENSEPSDKCTVMVIKSESVTTGILVQKLIGDEEILNKKLPEPMLHVKNISGITTLANGEMCLLLNVSDILSSNKVNPKALNTTKTLTLKDNSKYRILVVDDSVTTRRLLYNVLSSNGFNVDAEENVANALRAIESNKYDLIISDYEMPETNGLEFVQILRSKEKTKNIPIFIITSVENQQLIEEFRNLGIQEYIKKSYFEQRAFIRLVNKYLDFSIEHAGK